MKCMCMQTPAFKLEIGSSLVKMYRSELEPEFKIRSGDSKTFFVVGVVTVLFFTSKISLSSFLDKKYHK